MKVLVPIDKPLHAAHQIKGHVGKWKQERCQSVSRSVYSHLNSAVKGRGADLLKNSLRVCGCEGLAFVALYIKLMQLNAQWEKHTGHVINHLKGQEERERSVSVCMFNVCKQDLSQLGRFIRIDHMDYEARYTVKIDLYGGTC